MPKIDVWWSRLLQKYPPFPCSELSLYYLNFTFDTTSVNIDSPNVNLPIDLHSQIRSDILSFLQQSLEINTSSN